jgi:site-specific recombinase XerC
VSTAIKAWLDAKRAQGLADLTIVAYEQRIRMLLGSMINRPVRSVANRGPELYAAALEGRKADSHQNLLVAGRIWGKWCVRQKWLRANPFAEVDPVGRRVHGADKIRLTVDESRRLEAWCLAHPDDQGAVLTLGYLYLGTRNMELAVRDVRDLDDGVRLLLIGKAKSRAGQRKLVVPVALGALLRAQVDGRPSDAPVFVNAKGQRMGSNTARDHVKRVCVAAGVPEVPPQALRRTQASLAMDAGETSLAVARHLGQATGEAPKVTAQSYLERGSVATAQGERAMRAIRGRTAIGN